MKLFSFLYKTGQFKNISIDLEGSVVIISVNEKPIVSTITFHGADAIQPDKIKEGMLQMNLVKDCSLMNHFKKG